MKRNRVMPASVVLLAIVTFTVLCPQSWAQSFRVIYNFRNSPDGAEPVAGVTFDPQGVQRSISPLIARVTSHLSIR